MRAVSRPRPSIARASTPYVASGSGAPALGEREQRLLDRVRGDGDLGKPSGSMNPAQRVTRADHLRRRRHTCVELQYRKLVLQRADVRVGFVAEDFPQRG
jgi:hypothetical protein